VTAKKSFAPETWVTALAGRLVDTAAVPLLTQPTNSGRWIAVSEWWVTNEPLETMVVEPVMELYDAEVRIAP
jgi:hypothetical protein